MRSISLIILLLTICFQTINGSETNKECTSTKEGFQEETSVTEHSLVINGKEIKYKAYAGTLLFKDDKDATKGSFFYVAYIKEGDHENSKRPITFCFNGGPGSSSVWLHMGAFGPKRVFFQSEGFNQPPYRYVDNEYSLLDQTDLVFIDPISTGYSRAAPNEESKQFHGVSEDIKSVAEFIRLYITRNNRWDSPKFLAGESYGTTRAAGLAGYLHDESHIYINGIILVSSVLNFQTINADQGNDLPYILILPSYTAAAWTHQRLAPELQKDLAAALKQSEEFALNEYAWALMQGSLLNPERKKEIIQKIAYFTGISPEYVERANMRVCQGRFCKELLRDKGRVIGRFDSSVQGVEYDQCNAFVRRDPSWDSVFGPFTATFNSYVFSDLNWKKDNQYVVIADVSPWDYGRGGENKYLNVAGTLRDVMSKNPAVRVFVASGYNDLATPFFATAYTFNHLELDPSLRDHVSMKCYEGGHMMYTYLPSLKMLNEDISQFIQKTLTEPMEGLNN